MTQTEWSDRERQKAKDCAHAAESSRRRGGLAVESMADADGARSDDPRRNFPPAGPLAPTRFGASGAPRSQDLAGAWTTSGPCSPGPDRRPMRPPPSRPPRRARERLRRPISLLDARSGGVPELQADGLLISIARSGDSPESVGVVELIQRVRPDVRHLALMCNEHGRLATTKGVSTILLDPRTNDRSLAVTSGFSNLVLAGLALRHGDQLERAVTAVSARTRAALAALDASANAVTEPANLACHGAHAAGLVRRGARSVAQNTRDD